ncbi:MAG: TolC family protein [Planctomycetes bacterium]|nr:TolC family protein [Planctomycetota bacterium]
MRTLLLVLFALALGGCVVDPAPQWAELSDEVKGRGGPDLMWERDAADKKQIEGMVALLLRDGVTMDEAVRIALLNNRRLQAQFEEIGIGKADLVQAGMLTNPSLGALFQFAEGGGIAAEVGGSILPLADIWRIPLQTAAAGARMRVAILRVLQEIVDVARDAKIAFVDALHALQERASQAEFVDNFRTALERTKERHEQGYATELEVNLAELALLEQELDLARAEQDQRLKFGALSRLLGIEAGRIAVVGTLEQTPAPIPDAAALVAEARQRRADVIAADASVTEAERLLRLECWMIFKNVDLGATYTLEDETSRIGPRIDIQLPIFDQNQAQIAKARFKLRMREKEREELRLAVRQEIDEQLAALELNARHARLYRERIAPLQEKNRRFVESWPMQFSPLVLLETQRSILESRQRQLRALRDYAYAQARLDHARGRIDVARP